MNFRTRRIADTGGKKRKLLNAALEIAQAEGCSTAGATVTHTGAGHPKINVTGPHGKPITFTIGCTPKSTGRELNNVRRRIRSAIQKTAARARRKGRPTNNGGGHE